MGIVRDLVELSEGVFNSLLAQLRSEINDYCDIETTYGNSLVASDSSMAVVLKYDGFRSLVGKREFEDFTVRLADGLEPMLGHRGHQIQVVFLREDDPSDELLRVLRPSYDTCERLGLALTDLLDEKVDVHRRLCMNEQVFLVLWTRPSILDPVEMKISRQEMRELAAKYQIPAMAEAQNILRTNRFMVDRHESFVHKVVQLLNELHGAVTEVDVHSALCEAKRYLYRESTPATWRPTLVGDSVMARWKKNSKRDISEVCYPRIDDQLFSAPAVNGSKSGAGGVSDTRAVRVGSRLFAPVMVKIGPQRPASFMSLFNALNSATSRNEEGFVKPIPWSVSFMIEGDGLKAISLRKFFATLLGITSEDNRNLAAAANALERYKKGGEAVVKMQITALTWSIYPDERELMIRRSKLARAVAGWGNCVVEEETGDPTAGLMSCVPAMMLNPIAPDMATPLLEVTPMLPLSRPASPFSRGQSVLRTLDGKILPWEIFSSEQNTWITLLFGGPGNGKSVWANRQNTEMCVLPGLTRLPYIGVIDIGISASGFTSLIEDALPEDKRYLAMYARIQNTEKYRVNQLDTQLGCRVPLPREREAMKSWLVALVTPPSRDTAHKFMAEFVGRVIDDAFRRVSDQNDRGQPKEFTRNLKPDLTAKIIQADIPLTEATKWWELVDALFERGMYYEAALAQRYAVPNMFDITQAAADPDITKDFSAAIDDGISVVDEFRIMINAAAGDYPIFFGPTEWDVGESRVMALDLQDVVTTGSRAAKKQASLMYMMAFNAFMRKINLCEEELDSVNPRYRRYHAARVQELAEDFKRLFVDEYHKTGQNPNLKELLLIYGRESRKWGLEIVLASQLPLDFAGIADIATTIIILDSGNEQTRGDIKTVFGLSDTEVAALKNFVHGPQPGVGGTALVKIKTKSAELSQLFTATSGGLELWSLATTLEDRALRSRLYSEMPKRDARKMLKRRFAGGSCKSWVAQRKAMSKSETDGFMDEDLTRSVIQSLADEIVGEWRVAKGNGEL